MGKKYVAFLRGVNLGRRKVLKHELLEVFSTLGMNTPQTFLASGNVMFETRRAIGAHTLETGLKLHFGFDIGVVLRPGAELVKMVESEPFADYQNSADTKLYVTMGVGSIGERLDGVSSIEGDFDLIRVNDCDYFCVAYRQADGRFGAGMDRLERRFKDLLITTRNWNTILRIVKKIKG